MMALFRAPNHQENTSHPNATASHQDNTSPQAKSRAVCPSAFRASNIEDLKLLSFSDAALARKLAHAIKIWTPT